MKYHKKEKMYCLSEKDRDDLFRKGEELYYDSDLNWKFYVLAKNKTNQKKVTAFILEKMPTLTTEQAEEITTKFFERYISYYKVTS
jgi:hypothetical protein